MASNISEKIGNILIKNTGYKFNTWLNTTAKSDIYNVYEEVLGNDSTVIIYSNNVYYALVAFYKFNIDLSVKECLSFIDTMIHLQITSEPV